MGIVVRAAINVEVFFFQNGTSVGAAILGRDKKVGTFVTQQWRLQSGGSAVDDSVCDDEKFRPLCIHNFVQVGCRSFEIHREQTFNVGNKWMSRF